MSNQTFLPGSTVDTVRDSEGNVHRPPADWALLPPGDAALTRRVKAAGDHWIVQERKGRRTFSKGIWASADTIGRIRGELDVERSTESYAKRKAADKQRRDKTQAAYVDEFYDSVLNFLDFHPRYADTAARMARAITTHATPVGSGTVARTKRISVDQRAEAAVIAWMRHQTTAYDSMVIPRVKGKRREVRRMLAARSKQLLIRYRRGESIDKDCPLQIASASSNPAEG
ncbi:DUF2293 domain-containing protein [Novipirellula artificiosorum]|uniref:DUF2293 domain-containing protein n=1 Tax=Novipirellula artificiosorum TaxID=2528016 RepID=A0A5C6DCF7_9BACT|nr:DUF2293 domain-containing protein [Novipirellula artificiosorum]TWU34450.1 hypothetical protein Poly41_45980 [Novipirellula artificiosorum]